MLVEETTSRKRKPTDDVEEEEAIRVKSKRIRIDPDVNDDIIML